MQLRATRLMAYGRGRSAWTPAQIQTALWLDAADSSTITLNGSTVSQWADKSGNARNATQSTAASQPTYNASGLNNKPVISFDGTTDFLNVDGTWAVNSNYSVYLVTQRFSGDSNRFSVGSLTGSTANTNLAVGWASSTTFLGGQYGNDTVVTVPAYAVGESAVFAGSQQSSTSGKLVSYNGTITTRADTTPLSSNANWAIGRFVFNLYFTGIVSEIVCFTSYLDVSTRQRLEGYLAWKWGLEANLPANHPYKSFPPTA